VEKTPDAQNVTAGQPITFSIEVDSTGNATAQNVQLTDNLPQDSGLDWSESHADCSITGALGAEVLACTFGNLATGQSRTVTVTSQTDANDCGVYDNTASVTATGGLSDSDSGQVTVLCNGTIVIVKDTVPNSGTDFSFSDNIPAPCAIGTLDDDGAGGTPNTRTCSNVAPGQYTVTEAANSSYTLTNLVCSDANSTEDIPNRRATINLDSGETVTCSFTNTENGEITIRKDAQPDSATDFSFTDDIPGCNIGALDDDSNNTLDNDTECPNVPSGNYTVTENDPTSSGWALTGLTCSDANSGENVGTRTASIVLDPGEDLLCTFVNTQPPGSITIVKDAVPNSATDFNFTDNISGCTLGPLDDDSNGTLSNEDSCTSLTPGTYTVSENTPPAGWVLTNLVCSDSDSTENIGTRTATIVVGPGENVTCTFTNTQNGSITIVKDAVPNGPTDFSFTHNITGCTVPSLDDDAVGPLSNQATCSNVTPGQYTVTENDPSASGFALSNLDCNDANSGENVGARTATVNLEAGESVTCTFTNTQAGKIVVVKQTNPDFDPTDFTFDPSYAADFVLSDGEQNDSGNLVAGNYTVAELVPAGWALTGLNCVDTSGGTTTSLGTATASVALAPGETVTCTFTNTKAGKVIVKKVMQGGTDSFTFTGTPAGTISTNDGTISADVAPGTYQSTEDAKTGWTLTSITCDDGQSQAPSTGSLGTRTATFNVDAGETVTCTFTNVEAPSSIVVTKTADPTSLPEPGGNVTFTVLVQNTSVTDDVTLTAAGFTDAVEGGAAEVIANIDCNGATAGNGLPLTLQESDNAAGGADEVTCTFVKAVTGAGGVVIDDVVEVTGTDDDGTPVKDDDDASVTITANPGTIVIEKQTIPNGDPETFDFTGEIVATLGDGDTEPKSVAAGTYTVTESVEAGWVITSMGCNDGNSSGDIDTRTFTYRVAPGETVTCTVENTKLGQIVVEKQTRPDGDPAEFTFTGDVAASLSDGETASELVRPGDYSVTETVPAGWDLEEINCIDPTQNSDGNLGTATASFDVAAGETITCTFVNEKDSSIVVVKQTLPNGSQQLFDFDASYDEGGFSLGDGQQNDSGDLEPGDHGVSEDVPEGWDLDSIDCGEANYQTEGSFVSVSLSAGEIVTCTFTNIERGSIIVEKQTNPNGAAGTFSFTGDAAGSIGDNGQIVVDDLEPGTYTSTEGAAAGFNLTGITCSDEDSSGNLGTRTATFELDPGQTVTCTFTNTLIPTTLSGQGSISVSKTANPTTIKEPGGSVEFTVTIRNTGPIGVAINSVHDSVFGDLDDTDGGAGIFDTPINLAPGESVSKTFTRSVTGVGGQAHTNVVTASGTDAAGNPVSASDDARVEITPRLIDLVIVKTATSPTPLNGIVTYTMTVTNKGPDTATNVQLADPAPSGISYLTVSPSAPTCNLTPSLITCNLGNLSAGQSATITVTARATAVGSHTNVATVTGGGGRETNPADNVDDAVTIVPAPFVPPTKPKPEIKPVVCLTLTVTPKMIKADGRPDRVSVKVTAGNKRVKGTKVTIYGAGVRKSGRSNGKGMAFIRINPKKPGLITITALETNQRVCGPKRIGVVGVFLPPLTG
jgi:uncharacterized repeat protein (TIGR01451 family)